MYQVLYLQKSVKFNGIRLAEEVFKNDGRHFKLLNLRRWEYTGERDQVGGFLFVQVS